jgi:hypothetical protein
MKLIRLTTEDPNCIFNSFFSEDLLVKENSQITLHSVSIGIDFTDLSVDSSNDNIYYSLDQLQPNRKIILEHTGTGVGQIPQYNNNNYLVLLGDMTLKLNQTLQASLSDLGTQWKVSVNRANKVSIQALQSPLNGRTDALLANIPIRTLISGPGRVLQRSSQYVFSKADGEPIGNNNEYMTYYQYPITKGAGIFQTQIHSLRPDTSNINDGYIIALSSTNPGTYLDSGTNMTDAQISYGIHVQAQNGTYWTIEDGVWTNSAKALVYGSPANASLDHPYLACVIELKTIKLIAYETVGVNTVPTTLATFPYDNDTPLWPVLIMRGIFTPSSGVNARAWHTSLTADPYIDLVPTSDIEGALLGATKTPGQNPLPSDARIELFGQSLADFLGFTNTFNPPQGFLTSQNDWNFIADEKFIYTDVGDAFLILLDSLELDSFDDFDTTGNHNGGRQNILCVVPKADDDGAIIYAPPNLVWIDLNNEYPILLRNIRARILKNDYTQMLTNGLTSMTLLVRDKDEKTN